MSYKANTIYSEDFGRFRIARVIRNPYDDIKFVTRWEGTTLNKLVHEE